MTKTYKIIYWIATIWLALGMFSTGIVQLLQLKERGSTLAPGGAASVTHLGYPLYVLTLFGIWKILGVITVLIPKFPLLKEWAYAGFFFLMSGAIFSHIALHDSIRDMFPSLLLLILTLVSWYVRPVNRKIVLVNQ
ncbi:MAG TPA: DoxX family protein [Puia sp.]|nr:DoxX family protein [Puia sp.]